MSRLDPRCRSVGGVGSRDGAGATVRVEGATALVDLDPDVQLGLDTLSRKH